MYQFAYCFAIQGKVEWSSETAQSLRARVQDDERDQVEDFIESAKPGEHITLSSGVLIFRTAEPIRAASLLVSRAEVE